MAEGKITSILKWFIDPVDIDNNDVDPMNDFYREEALNDIYGATKYAVEDDKIIVDCPKGRAIISPVRITAINSRIPMEVFLIDYCFKDQSKRWMFHMNKSSLEGLGGHLRTKAQRGDFEEIFINE